MTRTPTLQPPTAAAELDEAIGLLHDALAPGWPSREAPAALRERLLQRVAASVARHQGLVTVRRDHGPTLELAAGAGLRWLYRRVEPTASRPGEPVTATGFDPLPAVITRALPGLTQAYPH